METETPVTEVKKTSKGIGLTLFLIVLLLAAIGLGVWGYMLGNNLKSTLAAQSALQAKHDDLTAQTNTLTTDLDKAKTDLEKAKTDLEKAKKDLATAQSDLSKSKENATGMQAKIDQALKYVGVISGMFVAGDTRTQTTDKIKAVNDSTLTEKFEKFKKSESTTDFNDLLVYLFHALADTLK